MDVVARAADGERLHLILLRDAAKIWPEPLSQLHGEQRFTIFRAPDAMNKATRERMHAGYSVVPAGTSHLYIIDHPALKRWAIVTAVPQACRCECCRALPRELQASSFNSPGEGPSIASVMR